ncbi:MAG: outer membrane protein assembly factor BamD [Phycisphaerales bacterium]|nr:outer membrane protein assembly factor BamD [Phycisphaerales bacterium]
MARFRSTLCLAVLISTATGLSSAAFGQINDTYRERLEYDVKTGEWVEIPAPVPGTAGGDLAIARAMLAQGEFKDARDAFKAWFKQYPESEFRREALFYSAETEIMAEDAEPKHGDLIQAYEWLEEILEAWPGSDLADRAVRREIIVAEMLLFKDRKQKIWKGTFWLGAEDEALAMLSKIADTWAINTPVAEQALRLKADYHYQHGQFDEAELTYARLMRDYPRGRYRKISLLRSGQSALARFPGVDFDDADLLEAEVYLRDFDVQYAQESEAYRVPETLTRIQDSLAEKDFRVAQFYERTSKLDASAFYYRHIMATWPDTTWASQSQERLTAIGGDLPKSTDTDVGDIDLSTQGDGEQNAPTTGTPAPRQTAAEPGPMQPASPPIRANRSPVKSTAQAESRNDTMQ